VQAFSLRCLSLLFASSIRSINEWVNESVPNGVATFSICNSRCLARFLACCLGVGTGLCLLQASRQIGICFSSAKMHDHQPCHLSSLTHPVVPFGSLLLLRHSSLAVFVPSLSCSSIYPASSASALQSGLCFLPFLRLQFSASITSFILTAWGVMYQAKGRGSRHRQGTWGWSWTWQMPLPLPQGQAHPRMGHPPLPLQVDTMPSAYAAWSHSHWLHERMDLVLS